jgi:undecaprenyl-diphosphatase
LNVDMAHPHLDQFWLFMTKMHKIELFMIVAVPAILGWLIYIYRGQVWKLIVGLALTIAVADALSYRLIKQHVTRLRPFQNPVTYEWVRKVGEAHGPSFPSNHAANAFAAAMTLTWFFPGAGYLFYIFASLIALSRIALGVHYPTDVFTGMMLGLFVGFLIRIFLLNQTQLFHLRKAVLFSSDLSSSWRTRSRRMKRPRRKNQN